MGQYVQEPDNNYAHVSHNLHNSTSELRAVMSSFLAGQREIEFTLTLSECSQVNFPKTPGYLREQ